MTKGKYGKWIGAGLGWAFGGPFGAIFGFALGTVFDGNTVQEGQENYQNYRHKTTSGDFSLSLLALSALVMRADGKILKSELDYVKAFFVKQFGVEHTKEQMQVLKRILEQEIPMRKVCDQIRYYMEHPLRLQLLHYLFGIALADGKLDQKELQMIQDMARYMGISTADFESIKAMFAKQDSSSAYKILEIDPSADDDTVKKAYRKMVLKYHPDKIGHLGESYQKAAKEKFQKVQEAYDRIKKERKLK